MGVFYFRMLFMLFFYSIPTHKLFTLIEVEAPLSFMNNIRALFSPHWLCGLLNQSEKLARLDVAS